MGDTHVMGDSHGHRLTKVPYVMQQFEKVGIPRIPEFENMMIIGIAVMQPGVSFDPLAPTLRIPDFTREERILWEWCRRRTDVFTLRVSSALALPVPMLCATSGSNDNSVKNASGVPLLDTCRRVAIASVVDSMPREMLEVEQQQVEMLTLTMPSILAYSMLSGHWGSHMLCRASVLRQRRLFLDWPAAAFWSVKNFPCREYTFEIPDSVGVMSAEFMKVADVLKRCASLLHGGGVLAPDAPLAEDLAGAIHVVEGFANAHSDYKAISEVPPRLVPLETLLETVLLSKVLKRQDMLKDILKKAINLTCPSWLKNVLHHRLDSGMVAVMSQTAVYRARQTVDLAFALAARETILHMPSDPSVPVFVYLWADASPQWGREWLLGHAHILRCSSYAELLGVVKAIDMLSTTSDRVWGQWRQSHVGRDDPDLAKMSGTPLQHGQSDHPDVAIDDGGDAFSSDLRWLSMPTSCYCF